MSAIAAAPQQVNLYNPTLLPKRERFSARQLVAWVVLALAAMIALAWWAVSQTRLLRGEMAQQAARTPPAAAAAIVTPQQVAAMEQAVRDRKALLETRRAARDTMKRGMADAGRGPSGVMRHVADSIPASAWITELRAVGPRIEIVGRTLDPGAVDAWLDRLRSAGIILPTPSPSVRIERMEAAAGSRTAPAYTFQVSAALGAPFADDGGRP